ncbi:MerR family DNA-binding transcriptional regulator [Amycolatopsis sp. GM8]|uniref:MerR family DNA-binding transcriptional regulator n=1 Tax=Amycolatopsis sp. GM8 TaxID=2896530 RepID=UPI001F018A2C|nr:MerR family DNA-binding transcriptional regulator [Amycolatopsis sp. GM8]
MGQRCSVAAGSVVRSLRYYEQQGLVTSTRAPSGQRHYANSCRVWTVRATGPHSMRWRRCDVSATA